MTNGAAIAAIASADVVSGKEAFMFSSFPSFSVGASYAFRLLCSTLSGTGTARGEIGVVAGPVA